MLFPGLQAAVTAGESLGTSTSTLHLLCALHGSISFHQAPRELRPAGRPSHAVKIGLIIIFNHRHEANLQALRKLHAGKFHEVVFLMPFADDLAARELDVISAHCGSYRFQGFLGEARKRLDAMGCDAYLVIADDLIPNPSLDQSNLHQRLGITADQAYTKNLASLYDTSLAWSCSANRSTFAALHGGNLQWRGLLPPRDEAMQMLERYGLKFRPLGLRNLRHISGKWSLLELRMALSLLIGLDPARGFFRLKCREVPYPLVFGYSDFFIVPAAHWDRFLHFCQVTTAMGIFVECAIPTALALACPEVVTELGYGENHHTGKRRPGMPMRGVELQWGSKGEREALGRKHDHQLNHLLENFADDVLYYHPVKLSQWQWEEDDSRIVAARL